MAINVLVSAEPGRGSTLRNVTLSTIYARLRREVKEFS